MTERQLQFRVGLFAIAAMTVMATLIFQFGEMRSLLETQYQVLVHFDSAPGVLEGSPVRLNGIPIGNVKTITLDRQRGGVLLTLSIDEKYSLRSDSVPRLQQSLLGDAAIEFTPGISPTDFDRQTVLDGETPPDVMEIVQRMEQQLALTMSSFDATSREWQLLARNMNSLVETNQGSLHDVVQRTATSLDEFTKTMQRAGAAFENANRVIADPQTVANLQKALAGLPQIVNETQQTISAMRQTVGTINGNLRNIENVTEPLAKHTTSIVVRLDNSLANLEAMTGELRDVAQIASKSDGSLKRFLSDPNLYDDLERSASSLAILLRNLEPIVQDMRVFTDKVARHPEVLGVGGALRPSSGLKDDELRQAGFQKQK
ncbi:MAG: MlaD family protein [Planctomycetota bacterium]|nr:MlaD family protein [Planctomycetota bacterium]